MSKDPTFSSSSNEFDESKLMEEYEKELDTWGITILKGIAYGLLILAINYLIVLFLNLLGYGGLFSILSLVLILESGIFFFIGSIAMFFGPSPTIADLKARITNSRPKYETTSISLRKGTVRTIIGLVLLLFS